MKPIFFQMRDFETFQYQPDQIKKKKVRSLCYVLIMREYTWRKENDHNTSLLEYISHILFLKGVEVSVVCERDRRTKTKIDCQLFDISQKQYFLFYTYVRFFSLLYPPFFLLFLC